MEKLEFKVDENLGIIEISQEGDVIISAIFENRKRGIVFLEHYEVINPGLRDKGVGKKAYELVRNHFKRKGIKKIRLRASQGREDGPYDTKNPYNFWVYTCGFKDIGDGRVEDRL